MFHSFRMLGVMFLGMVGLVGAAHGITTCAEAVAFAETGAAEKIAASKAAAKEILQRLSVRSNPVDQNEILSDWVFTLRAWNHLSPQERVNLLPQLQELAQQTLAAHPKVVQELRASIEELRSLAKTAKAKLELERLRFDQDSGFLIIQALKEKPTWWSAVVAIFSKRVRAERAAAHAQSRQSFERAQAAVTQAATLKMHQARINEAAKEIELMDKYLSWLSLAMRHAKAHPMVDANNDKRASVGEAGALLSLIYLAQHAVYDHNVKDIMQILQDEKQLQAAMLEGQVPHSYYFRFAFAIDYSANALRAKLVKLLERASLSPKELSMMVSRLQRIEELSTDDRQEVHEYFAALQADKPVGYLRYLQEVIQKARETNKKELADSRAFIKANPITRRNYRQMFDQVKKHSLRATELVREQTEIVRLANLVEFLLKEPEVKPQAVPKRPSRAERRRSRQASAGSSYASSPSSSNDDFTYWWIYWMLLQSNDHNTVAAAHYYSQPDHSLPDSATDHGLHQIDVPKAEAQDAAIPMDVAPVGDDFGGAMEGDFVPGDDGAMLLGPEGDFAPQLDGISFSAEVDTSGGLDLSAPDFDHTQIDTGSHQDHASHQDYGSHDYGTTDHSTHDYGSTDTSVYDSGIDTSSSIDTGGFDSSGGFDP